MKVFFKIVILLALIAYLGFAIVRLTASDPTRRCEAVEVTVSDSARAGFITAGEVERILKNKKIYPEGKRMDFVDSRRIETELLKNPFIDKVQCYKTPGGTLRIQVAQRLPVLRVMSEQGDDYFVDEKGRVMPRMHYTADLVVATGAIDRELATTRLLEIGQLLQRDTFWNSQIEQICVDKDGHVELIPRIGQHTIYLGTPTEVEQKFRRLRIFYEKVLARVGWNKYSRINVEFSNQIIGKKVH